MPSSAAYMRQYFAKRKAAGACRSCGGTTSKFINCVACRTKARLAIAMLRAKRVAEGKCINCAKPVEANRLPKRMCRTCANIQFIRDHETGHGFYSGFRAQQRQFIKEHKNAQS